MSGSGLLGRPDAADRSLRLDFEAATLTSLSHEAHVRVGWILLCEHPLEAASERIAAGLLRFATAAGVPGKFDAELTAAWMQRILHAGRALPHGHGWRDFSAAHPELLRRSRVHEVESVV